MNRARNLSIVLVAVLAIVNLPAQAADDAASAIVARMSEQSFALLAALNAQTDSGTPNPLAAPVAGFAADVAGLQSALIRGDRGGVSDAVGALQTDRTQIDDALRSNPKAIPGAAWVTLENELEQLTRSVTPATASAGADHRSVPPHPASIPALPIVAAGGSPVAAPSTSAAAVTATPSSPGPLAAPEISIISRTTSGNVVRVKGFVHGIGLKSLGIFEHGQELKAYPINGVPGEQRVNLDIGIADPSPDTLIRVVDVGGRSAEAPVNDISSSASPLNAEPPSARPDEAATTTRANKEEEAPTGGEFETGAEVAEIPSHGLPGPAPSKRHTLGTRLADTRIDILAVAQIGSTPPTYRIVGQIDGQGVTRAGVYANGRLIQRIPVTASAGFQPFDQPFVLSSGSAVTVRAYSVGSVYIEQPVDLTGNETVASAPSMTAAYAPITVHSAAPGVAVQITDVHPLAGNLYAVSGTVAGADLASAGLYQNGVLAQAISVSGGGVASHGIGLSLGGILGGLMPGGAARSVAFTGTFNPAMGPVTIRAYNRAGSYTEQPVPPLPANG